MDNADQDAFKDADVSMVVDYTGIAAVVITRKLFQVALQKTCQGNSLRTGRMFREPLLLSRKGSQVAAATNHSCARQS